MIFGTLHLTVQQVTFMVDAEVLYANLDLNILRIYWNTKGWMIIGV